MLLEDKGHATGSACTSSCMQSGVHACWGLEPAVTHPHTADPCQGNPHHQNPGMPRSALPLHNREAYARRCHCSHANTQGRRGPPVGSRQPEVEEEGHVRGGHACVDELVACRPAVQVGLAPVARVSDHQLQAAPARQDCTLLFVKSGSNIFALEARNGGCRTMHLSGVAGYCSVRTWCLHQPLSLEQ